jgi:AcrR family transcriptional regulator
MSPSDRTAAFHGRERTEKSTRRSNRRLEILRTSAHLFVERGFATTSMGDIAKASNISKPGLYYHFKSKQDLLAAIIDLAHDWLEADLEEIVASSHDLEERLRRMIHAHALGITKADDSAFSILAIEEVNSLLPADRERITRRKRAYVDFVRDALDELAADGRISTMDTMAAAYTLVGMVLWIPKWYQQTGRLSAERVADEITNRAMQSVLKSGQRSRGTEPTTARTKPRSHATPR